MVNLENLIKEYHLEEVSGSYFIIDMMYARPNNIVSTPVYKEIGFGDKAFLNTRAYEALKKLEPELKKLNMKLRICDAFRPLEAHREFLRLAPVKGLFKAVPEESLHCHGLAVDCCLTDENGNNLSYPTEIDAYTLEFAKELKNKRYENYFQHLLCAGYDFENCSEKQKQNRTFLKQLMESVGFSPIPNEWWHFNFI